MEGGLAAEVRRQEERWEGELGLECKMKFCIYENVAHIHSGILFSKEK